MIKVAKYCGTCEKINETFSKIYEIYEREMAKEEPKNIYIYQNIIDNKTVLREFKDLGIELINDLNELSSDGIFIIGPVGIKKEELKFLQLNNIEYINNTCEFYIVLQEKVLAKYNDGYDIFLVGNNTQKEINILNSYCDYNGIILSREEEFSKLNNNRKKVIILTNTSLDLEKQLENFIANNYISDLEIIKNECEFKKNIYFNNEDFSDSDVIFIIGDNNENNRVIQNNIKGKESYFFNNEEEFIKFILNSNYTNKMNFILTGGLNTPLKEIYNYKYLLSFLLFYKIHKEKLVSGQELINNGLNNDLDNDIVKNLIEYLKDLNKDGKYIRGILIALGEYLASGQNKDYLSLAYAYELFQTSILIHDDIIDNARERRGKQTIPRRICQKYLNVENNKDYQQDVLKLANSLGICMGDLGFYEANKLILTNYKENPRLSSILTFFNDIVIKTIKGEIIDVTLPFLSKYNYRKTKEQDILDIYELKTSWYTITGPFILGYLLGGKNKDESLEKVLNKIGIIFQLKDDLMGIFSSSKDIGKSNVSDIEEFKQTILYTYIMNTSYKDEFLKLYGKKYITDNELYKIRELLIKSGSYDYAICFLENLFDEVNMDIDELIITEEGKNILKGLIIFLVKRDK